MLLGKERHVITQRQCFLVHEQGFKISSAKIGLGLRADQFHSQRVSRIFCGRNESSVFFISFTCCTARGQWIKIRLCTHCKELHDILVPQLAVAGSHFFSFFLVSICFRFQASFFSEFWQEHLFGVVCSDSLSLFCFVFCCCEVFWLNSRSSLFGTMSSEIVSMFF